MRRTVFVLVALGGCDSPAPSPRPAAPTRHADAAPTPVTTVDAAPPTTTIGRDEPPPPGATAAARVVGGVRFTDAGGPGALYLLEATAYQRTTVTLQARLVRGDRTVRVVNDRADACVAGNLTAFAPPAVTTTDVDRDGRFELGFGYLVGCAGARIVAKQVALVDDHKFIIRGTAPTTGVPEPEATAWPADLLSLAMVAYRDNAGALVAAAAEAPAEDATRYVADSDVPRVSRAHHTLEHVIDWSYPALPMLAPAQAAALTARMVRVVHLRPPRGRAGSHRARCDLGLVTPEVASVACTTDSDLRPAPRSVGITVWRQGDLGDVTLRELGVTARRGCSWHLDELGVTFAPTTADAACGATAAWPELAPASDRAQALVTRMRAP